MENSPKTFRKIKLREWLPAESYIDTGDQAACGTPGGPTALHPVFGGERGDASLVMEALGYAPLCVTGPKVDRLRIRLARPAAMGRLVA